MEETSTVRIGSVIPDIEMDVFYPDKKDFGKIKTLDASRGGRWLVLFFYPADFTFVCPTELADMGEKYDSLKKGGVDFVSVSTDTHFVHLGWQSQEKLLSDIKFPMAGDPAHRVSEAFGVYDDATGLAFRGTFIVNPKGILCSSEVNYFSVGRNSDELVRKVTAFRYVDENPLQVCPAKWQPGKKTLTPGKDLVGKVGETLQTAKAGV